MGGSDILLSFQVGYDIPDHLPWQLTRQELLEPRRLDRRVMVLDVEGHEVAVGVACPVPLLHEPGQATDGRAPAPPRDPVLLRPQVDDSLERHPRLDLPRLVLRPVVAD